MFIEILNPKMVAALTSSLAEYNKFFIAATCVTVIVYTPNPTLVSSSQISSSPRSGRALDPSIQVSETAASVIEHPSSLRAVISRL